MAKLTRIRVPLRITYYLETKKDSSPVFEKKMTLVLDVDRREIESWAREDGISVDREIIQWITENYVHTFSSSDAEKAKLAKLAMKQKGVFKIDVTLNGTIAWDAA